MLPYKSIKWPHVLCVVIACARLFLHLGAD
jgi:hypothetical protein